MIPKGLQLVNFRSHKKTVIDLTNITVAAILGSNGVGKSSLVLAILYVLWGRIPKYTLLELVNDDGSTDMSVIYDFEDDDGDDYRIERSVKISGKKKKTALSTLTLSKYSINQKKWVDISGNSIGVTTAIIQKMLGGLTLDAAMYSNLAMQDEFSKFMDAEAGDRREIFETISNVGIYDRFQKKAKKRIDNALAVINAMDNKDEMRLIECQTRSSEIKIELEAVTQEKTNLEKDASALLVAMTKLEASINFDLTQDSERLEKASKHETSLQTRLDGILASLKEYETLLAHEEKIKTDYSTYQKLRVDNDNYVALEREYLQIGQKLSVAERNLLHARATQTSLEKELQRLSEKAEKIKTFLREKYELADDVLIQVALKEEMQNIETEISSLEAEKKEETATQLIEEERVFKNRTLLADSVANVKQAQETIKRLECSDSECPFLKKKCSRISGENLENEIANIAKKQSFLEAQQVAIRQAVTDSENVVLSTKTKIKEIEKKQQNKEKRIIEIKTDLRNASEQLSEAKQMTQKLSVDKDAKEKEIVSTEAEFEALNLLWKNCNYNKAEHDTCLLQMADFQKNKVSDLYQALLTAEKMSESVKQQEIDTKKELAEIQEEQKKLNKIIEERQKKIDTAEPELKHLSEMSEVAQEKVKENSAKYTSLLVEQSSIEAKIKQQERTREVLIEQQEICNKYTNLSKAYQMAKAFIVENSIPRYQESCNQMLDYLGLSVRIRVETLEEAKDSKPDKPKFNKVFKIIVVDNLGKERSYHTWSGGEKHRVNLALRHALSMTLLNRSGAKMGLVVIDEGDTRLDAAGKEALLKVIDATATGEFGYPAKVLFITHAEDLKDRLPARISLTKHKGGIKVTVN